MSGVSDQPIPISSLTGHLSEIERKVLAKDSPLLRVEEVSLTTALGLNYLLEEISFRVNPGEFVAIVGPSGAGKTSLLRLINRLNSPASGEIYLENQPYGQIPSLSLRRQVVLVLQEPKLLGMTVRETLAYPLQLRGYKPAEIQQRVATECEQWHIPSEWLERTELQLSAGQRQLVSIARATAIQPKILLLDEPTSALDAGRGAYVCQLLAQAVKAGLTILMVNHQLELAQEFASRLLYLENGRLIRDTPTPAVDWLQLRQALVDAEAAAAQEWNE